MVGHAEVVLGLLRLERGPGVTRPAAELVADRALGETAARAGRLARWRPVMIAGVGATAMLRSVAVGRGWLPSRHAFLSRPLIPMSPVKSSTVPCGRNCGRCHRRTLPVSLSTW